MDHLTKKQKQTILDSFGKLVIEEVMDGALRISMDIVKQKTMNPVKLRQYDVLSNLTNEEQEAVCDLLSETITDTVYRFLELFEENSDKMTLNIKKGEETYDIIDLSEKMGSEIACYGETGWIQKFSNIGRFVL